MLGQGGQHMYGELVVGLNMVFNYAILSFTNKIGNHQSGVKRLWIASFLGAFLVTVFPYSMLVMLLTFLGMTYVAFGQSVAKWKSSLATVLIAALFAGGLLTFVYSKLPVARTQPVLLFAVGLLYVSLYLLKIKWVDERTARKLTEYTVDTELVIWNAVIPLRSFIDTGNNCTEPLSGAPVHFVAFNSVRDCLPEDFTEALHAWRPAKSPDVSVFPKQYQKDLRLIRLQTVQGASWAIGIKYSRWSIGDQPLPFGYVVLTKEQRQYPQGASAILHVQTLELLTGERGSME